jgi:hypothetical protein
MAKHLIKILAAEETHDGGKDIVNYLGVGDTASEAAKAAEVTMQIEASANDVKEINVVAALHRKTE